MSLFKRNTIQTNKKKSNDHFTYQLTERMWIKKNISLLIVTLVSHRA